MKRREKEEEVNLERWLVSYADFVTLLFATFTALFALSQTNKLNYQRAIISIQRAFLSGGGIFPLKGYPLTPFDAPPEHGTHVPPSADKFGHYPEDRVNESLEKFAVQLRGLYARSATGVAKKSDIEIIPTAEGFKIRLGESVVFKPGSDRINYKHLPFLYELGNRLNSLGVPIQVEGHTDSLAADNRSNWQLSVDRATTVMKFFVSGTQFPPDKISLAGYGDTKPIAENSTPDGRSKNRRVEIVVMTEQRRFSSVGE